ncbi:MAG: phage integrase family protein [Okeania sp. SIO3H1]|uniref:tyrosine-type recombinase/integrase n=1 Tax=Okeania sp. SIO1I7 TaxID=2607772 RepID=UPI0013C77871|nr:tyrosine-type recombinase/integrase [Okeania sp. SIO1I7]NEN92436.1 phage integrase family protein [Okeania sp. SIO3H1]NET27022.1 phage integrase family protein [Okeania sp. SIO1I7]
MYESEIDALLDAAKASSKSVRNLALVLVMYRHGLRATEALAMQWQDINFKAQEIYIRRCKGSVSGAAPLWSDELKALSNYRKKICFTSFIAVYCHLLSQIMVQCNLK